MTTATAHRFDAPVTHESGCDWPAEGTDEMAFCNAPVVVARNGVCTCERHASEELTHGEAR